MDTDQNRRLWLGAGLTAFVGSLLAKPNGASASNGPPADAQTGNTSSTKGLSKTAGSDIEELLVPPAAKTAEATLDLKSPPPFRFTRSAADEKVWRESVNRLVKMYPLTTTGTIAGKINPLYQSIDNHFKFVAQKEDDAFSMFHVEPLLDQAADLLDRGIRDRATWDELGAKWSSLMLELQEYAVMDEIHQREEKAGMYDVPAKRSGAEYAAESATAAGALSNADKISWILANPLSNAKLKEIHWAAECAAWLTGLVPWSYEKQRFDGYNKHAINKIEKTVADHAADFARTQSAHSLAQERSSVELQLVSWKTNMQSSELRRDGYKAVFEWDSANANFLRERTMAARRLQDIRVKLASDPDGLLNFSKRRAGLEERFKADFRDALARLNVVRDGLKAVYGYDVPLPSAEKNNNYFDDCLLWTRSAIQWLIRFARQEQGFVYPISVRQLVGEKEWTRGLEAGKWRFSVTRQMFEQMTNVRVRGLTAFAEVNEPRDANRLWRVKINLPPKSITHHYFGTSAELDQSRIPPAHLHRVTSRSAQREPDVVGMAAWHNASPIGEWALQLTGAIPFTDNYKLLSDIVIDVSLGFRASALGK